MPIFMVILTLITTVPDVPDELHDVGGNDVKHGLLPVVFFVVAVELLLVRY